MKKSCVHIEWLIPGRSKSKTLLYSSGYVCNKTSNGLFIISSCNQLDRVVPRKDYEAFKTSEVRKKVEVTVQVYDRNTIYEGELYAFCRNSDLTLCFLALTNEELSEFPATHIEPAHLSTDEVYPRQACYAIHNPEADNQESILEFNYLQETMGHIVEPRFELIDQPTRVHFQIDLIMSGSLGAPIFDLNSHKVLGIVCGEIVGTTNRGLRVVVRHYAVSVETIEEFLTDNRDLIV